MGEKTDIEWTDMTFSPWWGCTKISPACDFCYAENWARRFGVKWGPGAERRIASERYWQEPLKWNAKAMREGKRRRVFCASMSDVFDNDGGGTDLDALRARLWALIEATPMLDWLLLTKRIGNVRQMWPASWFLMSQPNVWLGATVVNQQEFDRDLPKLLSLPARVRFLSIEPMLEPIEIGRAVTYGSGLHWVICGGESGRQARPLEVEWAESLRTQCERRDIAFFMKQGSQANWPLFKDFTSFPPSLRAREFPI